MQIIEKIKTNQLLSNPSEIQKICLNKLKTNPLPNSRSELWRFNWIWSRLSREVES